VLGADAGIRVRRVNCRCAADTRRSRTPALVREVAASGAGQLPSLHHDPFDRLIAVQARMIKGAVITNDSAFHELDVEVFW